MRRVRMTCEKWAPTAPLWLRMVTPEKADSTLLMRVKEATSPARASRKPMQFGPISRMPAPRAMATISRCMAAPSGPASAKPELSTTAARAPASADWRTAATTPAAGTATMARSGACPIAATLG